MTDLPPGWTSATIAELIAPDGTFSDGDWVESKDQDPTGAIRLLQLADIGDGVFVDKSNRFVNDEKFEQLRCTEVFEGDVLIARMPDPLGRACLAPKLRQRCITVVDVAIVRPGPSSVRPKWLMHFLNAPQVRQVIELQSSGTTRRRISRGNLAQLELPVPPIPEQSRISDRLDSLLSHVDACRERFGRVAGILKRFRQAVLAAATSGELTREWREERGLGINGWTRSSVGQLIDGIEAGLNVQCEERPPADSERGLVKISAVTWGTYDDNESKTLPPSAEVPERARIRIGDFLISRANTLELVGACVIVHRVTRPVFLSDKILRLVMPEDWKPWLLLVLQSPEGRREIESRASGNQLSMRNLSQVNLREIGVPIPTPEERAEIVRRAKSLLAFADGLERRCGAEMSILGKLTPSVLAKAFRGELVPQDPKDEPAGALLARIAAERSAPAASSRPRSPRVGRPPRAPKETATMTKSRQDDDVLGKPYLAGHLRRIGAPASAEALFKAAELPVADFYKQLAWEVAQGHVKDNQTTLEPGHAAG